MTRVKLNLRAFNQLRNSPEVIAVLEEQARDIAARAGEGFETRPAERGKHRARVAVVTAGFKAMLAEAKHRTLTRAVGR